MKKQLGALALLVAASSSWGALCTDSNTSFGTVSDTTGGNPYTYAAACTAIGISPSDPDRWTFTHELTFSLAQAGDIFGVIDLNFTRSGPLNPENPGAPLFVVDIDPILLVHDGVTTPIGGEGAGQQEVSRFRAFDLEAGDYSILLRGRLFDVGARSGFYDGTLNVRYGDIAAPVPEPATLALLALGVPVVAGCVRRRRTPAST